VAAVTMAQANRALRKLPEDARLAVEEVSSVTAFQIVQTARSTIPLGPGRHGLHLRDAVSWQRTKGGARVRVDRQAFHWKFLEYGTVKMRAIGMFRAAGEAIRGDHAGRLLSALERATRQMVTKA
jgi:HK97 gp10 family phage protein